VVSYQHDHGGHNDGHSHQYDHGAYYHKHDDRESMKNTNLFFYSKSHIKRICYNTILKAKNTQVLSNIVDREVWL
jgi:hypothetical protein